MNRISFVKKLITCILAGCVIGETVSRMGVTYFTTWVSLRSVAIILFLAVVATVVIL